MTTNTRIDVPQWKTDDVTLAAFLKMHAPLLMTRWEHDKCYWIFEDTDDLADLVSEYIGGKAEGNLKEYNSIIAALKREMYDEQRERRGELSTFRH